MRGGIGVSSGKCCGGECVKLSMHLFYFQLPIFEVFIVEVCYAEQLIL
jgi:hypothetical protein